MISRWVYLLGAWLITLTLMFTIATRETKPSLGDIFRKAEGYCVFDPVCVLVTYTLEACKYYPELERCK